MKISINLELKDSEIAFIKNQVEELPDDYFQIDNSNDLVITDWIYTINRKIYKAIAENANRFNEPQKETHSEIL